MTEHEWVLVRIGSKDEPNMGQVRNGKGEVLTDWWGDEEKHICQALIKAHNEREQEKTPPRQI